MAFRFLRRFKIAPGLSLNLSKSGVSVSLGGKGAKYTVGTNGQHVSLCIPGSGLFYTKKILSTTTTSSKRNPPAPSMEAQREISSDFLVGNGLSGEEQAIVDAWQELLCNNEAKALEYLKTATSLADGAFFAGILHFRQGAYDKAETNLRIALNNSEELGKTFLSLGITARMSLHITDEVTAVVGSDIRGVLFALGEIFQHLQRWGEAIACLESLQKIEPNDPLVILSLVELILEAQPGDIAASKKVLSLTEGLVNKTEVHTAILYYKAISLNNIGLRDAALDTLTDALRLKKGRSAVLLKAIRYRRALVYGELGQEKHMQNDLEKLYAEDPEYEDVASRLF